MPARISWSLPIVTTLSAVLMLLAPPQARADLEVSLSEDGGAPVVVTKAASFTAAGFNGIFGDFEVDFFGAVSKNGALSYLMTSTTSLMNLDMKKHELTISVTQDGYSLPVGPMLDMTSHIGGTVTTGGAGQALTFQSYANNNNGLFNTVGATTTGPQSPNVSVSRTSYDSEPDPSVLFARTTSMYSVTTTNAITLVAGGTLNFATSTTLANAATPAPAGLILVLTALPALGVGGWLRRRHRKACS
jgi:hypothetical protein